MHHVTCDFTLIPIGTNSTSVSEYVKEVPRILKTFPSLTYEISGMAASLEGDIDEIYSAIRTIQEALFDKGLSRVYTVIKIDDRRDEAHTLKYKKEAVQ
ncbi:hypothetical protein AOC36_07055 [Erysipelothrix larvae]|uniref:Thiamine-binding protein domain-containing protein n=1 Tax=Erysipelothrix larvae TaxID=1514105 RepID=A0A120JTS4_9FIRM|nr:MTH1187 family thiamine-binding protein [Erysipelothrix larvae]AMC93750.1 hypothetical protein AOC36_07055 [Erysipelothrix larvae]